MMANLYAASARNQATSVSAVPAASAYMPISSSASGMPSGMAPSWAHAAASLNVAIQPTSINVGPMLHSSQSRTACSSPTRE
jgi:hypothetical protein